MPFVDWYIKGVEFASCNCDWGCPCQFNGPPSRGHCRALTFVQVERGRYADVPLDGLRWGVLVAWPGPIHMGDGRLQVVVDQQADLKQRKALEAIAHGRDTEPGTLVWQIYSTTISCYLPTLARPIQLEIDVNARMASLFVPGVVQGSADAIRNPKTGAPHRARVTLPAGFEYTEAEFASGRAVADGAIALELTDSHAHVANVHWTTHGVVREH
jgi:hypothetical protein